MNRVPDLSHRRIVRALEKVGFRIVREGKHITMYSREKRVVVVIPWHNPVKRGTLARILKDIDLSPEEFRDLI